MTSIDAGCCGGRSLIENERQKEDCSEAGRGAEAAEEIL